MRYNKVYGYNFSNEGLEQKPYLNHTWPYAAGSLCSTTKDLLNWMTAIHKQKIISDTLYQSLITPGTLNDSNAVNYAKGLVNYSNYGHQEIGHGGGINGFLSQTQYFPNEDLYIICLVNTTGPKGGDYFSDKITWKLLNKKEYKSIPLDIDITALTGTYSGQIRGKTQSIEVNTIENGITLKNKGREQVDTLTTYIGNHTWMDGNNIITIKDKTYRKNQMYGCYILKKEK